MTLAFDECTHIVIVAGGSGGRPQHAGLNNIKLRYDRLGVTAAVWKPPGSAEAEVASTRLAGGRSSGVLLVTLSEAEGFDADFQVLIRCYSCVRVRLTCVRLLTYVLAAHTSRTAAYAVHPQRGRGCLWLLSFREEILKLTRLPAAAAILRRLRLPTTSWRNTSHRSR
eukprot:SAG11_NODE_50_length_19992_cov_9.945157_27_plen_168_part_00